MKIPEKIIYYTVFLFAISVCFSATLYVDDNAPNDPAPGDASVSDPLENGTQDHPFDAIQEAITAAAPNDTVLVSEGTYTGNGNRDIDFLGKAITVQSQSGPENCIIDCQGTEADPHRAFIFQSGETHNSILSGFSIINGYAEETTIVTESGDAITTTYGGGVFSENSSPVITSCLFENCFGNEGGAIYCSYGTPIITNSTFRRNYGGAAAIRTNESSLTISNCHFTANDSSKHITCFISSDPITIDGAGAILLALGNANISNCTFSGNIGAHNSGISIIDTKTSINNCEFIGNRSEYYDCLFGFFIGDPEEIQINKLFSANNCIFWNNNSSASEILDGMGYGIDPESGQAFFFQIYEINYSCVQTLDSNLPGLGNIDIDPLFVDSGYWDPNDTPNDPNDDIWVEGDYHLKSEGWSWDTTTEQWTWDDETSPCIDAGNPGMALGDEPTTLDVDPLNRWGENIRINIGAYGGTAEASMASPGWALLCDLDNSGIVNLSDFTTMSEAWLQSAQNLPPDISRNGTVNLDDVALLAQDWLKTTTWH